MDAHVGHSRGAITYLCQVRHSSYQGRDSLVLLQESLALLHRHYNDQLYARHDVLLFHTGDFGAEDQRRVLAPYTSRSPLSSGGGRVRFERVPAEHWRLPLDAAPQLGSPQLNRTRDWLMYPRYSEGYRHMCRWYTIGLWETLEGLGYAWVMRLDEDSRLLSRVPMNVFAYLIARRMRFGFRMVSYESGFGESRRQQCPAAATFCTSQPLSSASMLSSLALGSLLRWRALPLLRSRLPAK